MTTDEQKELYRTQGYFVVDDAVEPDMLKPLLDAAKRVKKKVRSGEVDVCTHRGGPAEEPWAIRGMFAPEMGEPIFADYLLSEPIMNYVRPFLGDELQLGGVTLFTNPYEADFSGGWHRDFGQNPRDGTEEVEMEILNRPMDRIKWHLALVDDFCLELVPHSQGRYRTDAEQEVLMNNRQGDMHGQMRVKLKAGRTAFWNGNIMHRGMMKKDVERLTLAANWSQYQEGGAPEEVDQRLEWMLADNLREYLPPAMHGHYDRWRALQLERS